jgi:phage-related protein
MATSQAALEIILRARDEATKILENTGGALSTLGGIAGSIATGGLALAAGAIAGLGTAAVGAAAGIADLALQAAPLEGIGDAFETMSSRVGLSLDEMRNAAKETIPDFELMRMANVALTGAGDDLAAAFGDKLPQLLEIARATAKSTGQDVGFMFESLVTGIKRTSPMLIDNTGLQLRLAEANQTLADQLGKSVEDLTAEEQQIALLNATLEAGQKMVDEFGSEQLSAAENVARLKTQIQNTKDQIGVAFLPALNAVLQPLGDLAATYGPQVVEWAEQAGQWLGENLPVAIAWLQEKWTELWPQVQEGLSTAWAIAEPILSTLASWFSTEGPEAVSTYQSLFQEKFGWIIEWFQENWPLIQETAQVVMDAIHQVVGTVLGLISAFWQEHGDRIMAIVRSVWNIIWTIFDTYLKNIFDAVKVVMQLITGDWEGAHQTLQNMTDRVWGMIRTIVENTINGIRDWIRGFDLREVGRQLLESLKQGVLDAARGLIDAVRNAVGDALRAARETLGIGSPSRAFVEMGQYMMQGLQMGLEQFGDLPRQALDVQMRHLIEPPTLAPAYAGVGTGTYHITINVGSVRSDEDIEEIRATMERIMLLRGVRSFEV